ncbi:hypothetical protein Rsub_10460 [Raphidocelis subcapitata]|uniref:von Hippel-Lindau disease tumour suppressor beta domain-containing protein n=1 Tax=Raphidocelis subcapitata TaxID=307507 RepID=A0A2V0PJP6_9CHLO|nr:hypothetical protein Rsub_10460 [Raphidocelis subcapitata]|eukprot:GBF97537.1 hypothetical protein Rsub_10460 [Raphidocelis subcapitata]
MAAAPAPCGEGSSAAAATPATPLFCQPPLSGLIADAPLKQLRSRSTLRDPPADDAIEATWYLPDAVNALAEPTPVRLRSVHSKQAGVIRFCNKSARSVRALWVDFDGHEVVYSLIEPGTTRLYRTYATHPWIVRELTTGARMMLSGAAAVVGMAEEQSVDITDPPELGWGLGTHRCFPGDFKTAARQLLLAHHRLAAGQATPAAAAAALPAAAAASPRAARAALLPPCSPLCTAAGGPVGALTTTTTRLQLSTPQTQLSIAITTDVAPAGGARVPACCSPMRHPAAGAALLSPFSPRRTINISVNATGSSLGVNIESCSAGHFPGAAAAAAMSPRLASRGLGPLGDCASPLGASRKRSAIASLVSTPTRRRVAQPLSAAPLAATDLGDLPLALVVRIVELAAPKQWQGVHMPRVGRPDVRPTQLACPPDTKTQREEEEEAAAAAAAQQQQQQQLEEQVMGGAVPMEL